MTKTLVHWGVHGASETERITLHGEDAPQWGFGLHCEMHLAEVTQNMRTLQQWVCPVGTGVNFKTTRCHLSFETSNITTLSCTCRLFSGVQQCE